MLFMVIEDFKDGDPNPIRERIVRDGRMLPDGVIYHASWVDPANSRCFQVMEAKDRDALQVWANCWADLVDFKIAFFAGIDGNAVIDREGNVPVLKEDDEIIEVLERSAACGANDRLARLGDPLDQDPVVHVGTGQLDYRQRQLHAKID